MVINSAKTLNLVRAENHVNIARNAIAHDDVTKLDELADGGVVIDWIRRIEAA